MFFNSIFRNFNVTFLCIMNTLAILYAACPVRSGRGGGVGDSAPSFLKFLDQPLSIIKTRSRFRVILLK